MKTSDENSDLFLFLYYLFQSLAYNMYFVESIRIIIITSLFVKGCVYFPRILIRNHPFIADPKMTPLLPDATSSVKNIVKG